MRLKDKMYPCTYCEKTYAWPSDLKRHVRHKHILKPMAAAAAAAAAAPAPAAAAAAPAAAAAAAAAPGLALSNKSLQFQHPFTMTISGPTGSGKTQFFLDILKSNKINPKPERIVYLYKRWQPLYDKIQEHSNVEFIKGIPHDLDNDSFFDTTKNNLVLIDDLMHIQSDLVANLFTEGSHHRNLSVINVTQNLFPPGKHAVTQRRNTQYMVIFKSPMGQDQIRTLAGFMFPGHVQEFLGIYQKATSKPHGYIIIDSKQNTPDADRLNTDIFHEQNHIDSDNFFDMLCDERHIAKRYHEPYMKWLLNPQANEPENWKCYLENMINEDLEGIHNPKALAHLCVSHAAVHGNNVQRHCEDCNTNSVQGSWLAKCPKCEEVHIYPKHGWTDQDIDCQGCTFSFHTTDDTCKYIVAFCKTCNKAWFTAPTFKKSKRGCVHYVEINL